MSWISPSSSAPTAIINTTDWTAYTFVLVVLEAG